MARAAPFGSPAAVRDAQLRHKISVQRHGQDVLNKAIKKLDAGDQQIIDLLSQETAPLDAARFAGLMDQIRRINEDSYAAYARELEDWQKETAAYERDFQASMLRHLTGEKSEVPTMADIWKDVRGTPVVDNLQGDMLAAQADAKFRVIQRAIQNGIAQDMSAGDIARMLRGTAATNFRDGVFATARTGADRLTRTLVNHAVGVAAGAIFNRNKRKLGGVQWVATLDTATCLECAALDGKIFATGRGPRPPLHYNCRCVMVPVTDNSSAPPRFDDWLKSQTASVQDEALGPTRGQLFRTGRLPVDRFVDVRGNELTLDQLREKEAGAFSRAGLSEE